MKSSIVAILLILGCPSLYAAAAFTTAATDYIRIRDNNTLTPASNQLTIVAWIKPNTNPTGIAQTIISKRNGGGNNDEYNLFYFSNEGGCSGGVASSGMVFRVNNVAGLGCNNVGVGQNRLLGVVAVFTGTSGTVWVNGISSHTRNVSTTISNGVADLIIGGINSGSGGSPFNGTIYAVGIYSRAFSSQEAISFSKNYQRPPIDSSCMGLWMMDEGVVGTNLVGARIIDHCQNRNDGTVNTGSSVNLLAAKTEIGYPE